MFFMGLYLADVMTDRATPSEHLRKQNYVAVPPFPLMTAVSRCPPLLCRLLIQNKVFCNHEYILINYAFKFSYGLHNIRLLQKSQIAISDAVFMLGLDAIDAWIAAWN